jgi:hypothetical protein
MRFAVAGELALDAAEALQVLERHLVETVVGAQGVDAVLGVAGVVDEIVGVVPGAALRVEHDSVDGGHHLREGRGPTPMTGSTAVDCMDIHQRHQGPGRPRIGEDNRLVRRTLHGHGVFRRLRRGAGESRAEREWSQRWSFEGFYDGSVSGHRLRIGQMFE